MKIFKSVLIAVGILAGCFIALVGYILGSQYHQSFSQRHYNLGPLGISFDFPLEWYIVSPDHLQVGVIQFTKVPIPEGEAVGERSFLLVTSEPFTYPGYRIYTQKDYIDTYAKDGGNGTRTFTSINQIPVMIYQESDERRYLIFTKKRLYQFVLYQKLPPPNPQPPYSPVDISKLEKLITSLRLDDQTDSFVDVSKM